MRSVFRTVVLLSFVCFHSPAAFAQAPPPPDPAQQPVRSDPDIPVDALQPDFNLAALPTTLRMPSGKWAFRVTHRFTRSLGEGDIGDLFANAFGLDGGSLIGLEVRYGVMPGVQVGVHRTSDKTIQFFGQQSVLSERYGDRFGLDGIVTLEGLDNFSEDHMLGLGVVLSKNYGRRAAFYAEPMVVLNSNALDDSDEADHTLMMGLGARVRLRPSLYGVAEFTPRLAGFDAGANQFSFGFEHRTGGHLFQLNLSNGFGTTLGQLANGTLAYDNWYLGFNISRKFF